MALALTIISTLFISLLTLIIFFFNKKKKKKSVEKQSIQHEKNIKNKNYVLVTNSEIFNVYFDELKRADKIGIDTEFFSGLKYKTVLSLVQISIEKFHFALIIDNLSLSPEDKKNIYQKLAFLLMIYLLIYYHFTIIFI